MTSLPQAADESVFEDKVLRRAKALVALERALLSPEARLAAVYELELAVIQEPTLGLGVDRATAIRIIDRVLGKYFGIALPSNPEVRQ